MDRLNNMHGYGLGIVPISPKDIQLEYSILLNYNTSNNKAGYEALITGLQIVMFLKTEQIKVFSELQIVVN